MDGSLSLLLPSELLRRCSVFVKPSLEVLTVLREQYSFVHVEC